jgi:hypothetical protein
MPKRDKKGGASSGWQYVFDQVGDGWTQFQNALTLQPGQNLGSVQSNDIEPIGKPNFQNNQGEPSVQNLRLIQMAGKRRKRRRTRRGGDWGAVASQAAVPLALLAMQNTYKKRGSRTSRKSRRKSRKSRKSRRR